MVLDRGDIARLPEVFPPAEFYCPPSEEIAVEVAREQRGHFNIIHHETGFKADVYLSGRDPFHAWGLARARRLEVEGQVLVVAPPEYVIVRKLEYYREGGSEKHLRDIRSILDTSPAQSKSPNLNGRLTRGAFRRRGGKFRSTGIDFRRLMIRSPRPRGLCSEERCGQTVFEATWSRGPRHHDALSHHPYNQTYKAP